MTGPRIYVASLSDYNAGTLHGEWIDADQDTDAIWEEINAMLAASPENKQCQWCGNTVEGHDAQGRCPNGAHMFFPGKAEEWAIHDYEGFYGLKLGEWEDIERVATIGQALAEANEPEALAAWLDDSDDNTVEDFDDHFRGRWDSFKAFVEDSDLGEMICGLATLKELAREGGRFSFDGRGERAYQEAADTIEGYLDWDSIARAAEDGYTTHTAENHDVFVFEDNV